MRKWILAGSRRDTDRWAWLSYLGGGERKQYADFYAGAKRKTFFNKTYVQRGGSVLKSKVRACRAAPQNLLDFAFSRDKIKPKQKDFGYCVGEKQYRAVPH